MSVGGGADAGRGGGGRLVGEGDEEGGEGEGELDEPAVLALLLEPVVGRAVWWLPPPPPCSRLRRSSPGPPPQRYTFFTLRVVEKPSTGLPPPGPMLPPRR